MKVLLFLACDSTSTDRYSNRLSVFNIFDGVVSTAFPLFLPNLSVCEIFEREQGDGEKISLNLRISQGGAQVGDFPIEASFGTEERLRAVQNVSGLPIQGPTPLRFEVHRGGEVLATWEVPVRRATGPMPPGAGVAALAYASEAPSPSLDAKPERQRKKPQKS